MSKRIVLMGECMVELRQLADNAYQQHFAGDVFNTAVYLKRSSEPSLQVQFFSAVGTDWISDKLVQAVMQEKIDSSLLLRTATAKPGLYLINTDSAGERSFVYWRDSSAAKQTLQCFSAQRNYDALKGCKLFYFSGITLAILSAADREQLFTLLRKLKADGSQIVFDPNYRPVLWPDAAVAQTAFIQAYRLSDIALPGLDDHRVLFAANSSNDVVAQLAALGVNEIIVKDGKNGITGRSLQQAFTAPAHPVEKVVDTTSAGDAFNGGYLAARLAGLAPQRAVIYAARLASLVVEHSGAIISQQTYNTFATEQLPFAP